MEKLSKIELKARLDELTQRYNTPEFIASDPISIPHRFESAEDIEIAGFLVSLIAWGNRTMILRSADSMMQRLENSPADFVKHASPTELNRAARGFVHRTFNEVDFFEILTNLQRLVVQNGSLQSYFESQYRNSQDIRAVLSSFRSDFFNLTSPERTLRHISSIDKGSACKRLCMFLRWMVRRDDAGVDFGLWRGIPPSALYIPLDVHSARQGRHFGLLHRKSDDWKTVEELTASLREFDAADPVKYDFALFGLGVSAQ